MRIENRFNTFNVITPTTVLAGADTFIVDLNHAADADVGPTAIPHGLLSTPLEVEVSQRTGGSTAAGAVCGYTYAVDGTNLTVTKVATFAGSLGISRWTVKRPHSIGR